MTAKRLLVIDDDRDSRTLIECALEIKTDWEIMTASSGKEGFSRAESQKPDAILIDLIMPTLDGITLCELLKCNLSTCAIPVIFITAMAYPNLLMKLKASGAVGTIVKPINLIDLDAQIAELCNWVLSEEPIAW